MIAECLVVEFRVEGDDCPLAAASRDAAVAVNARPPQRREDGYALLRFSAPADDGLVEALEADDRIRYLHVSQTDGRYNFRCLSKRPCIVHDLVSAGFLAESLRYRDGVARFTGAVVGRDVLWGVQETVDDTVGVYIERLHPLGAEEETPVAKRWDLTPRQEAALRTAYELGYFSVPREATAAEVADELGISKSAFLERLRRGQSTLFSGAF